MNCLNRKW